jgi:hydroxysqualene dehydroxylase
VTIFVIGAGIAGLSAAVTAAAEGAQVHLIEASPQAGGRCRSFDDTILDRRIDNGSHVLIGANPAAFAFLQRIGARDSLVRLGQHGTPFVDLESGERWTFRAGRPIPGGGVTGHLRALALLRPAGGRTVRQVLGGGPMMRRFWEPLTVAALNTGPARADAALLRRILGEILRHGRAGLDLYMARDGLSESFVEPALAWLAAHRATVTFGQQVRGLATAGQSVTGLETNTATLPVSPGDHIVLATPAAVTHRLLPDIQVPMGTNAIVNGHFRVDPEVLPASSVAVLGLCGGTAQWAFQRGDILSLTVSDANAHLDTDQDTLARKLWRDVAVALKLGAAELPPHRIIREKRATFDQTPANEALRPPAQTRLANLFLAGDWTDTGLPATIEGATRSGGRAARLALGLESSAQGTSQDT